jgi:hypothetical protein
MSAAHDVAVIRSLRATEVSSAELPPPFNPSAMRRLEGRPVIRRPEQLRLHPALDELGWTGVIDELNEAARLKNQSVPEPILITTDGTILAGFGRWRLAVFEGRQEIPGIEYPLSENESLQFILTHHQTRHGWNAFVRIRLALRMEPNLQQWALDNMRAGGKYKGSTNLPKAHCIDVRQEIARLAGTGTGNVSKVKTILLRAHPSIVAALQNDLLKIHRAWKWCKLSKLEQKAEFARYEEERTQRNILREFSAVHAKVLLDPGQVIKTLEEAEARHPGSIAIRTSRSKRTVVILGQDLLEARDSTKELNCDA